MIRNDNVQTAIKGQLGLSQLGSKLKKCLRETEKLKDWPQVRETVMDYAKLTGQLVEKREVRSVGEEEQQVVRSLVDRCLRPSAATGRPLSLTPSSDAVPPPPSAPSSPPSASSPPSLPAEPIEDSANGN